MNKSILLTLLSFVGCATAQDVIHNDLQVNGDITTSGAGTDVTAVDDIIAGDDLIANDNLTVSGGAHIAGTNSNFGSNGVDHFMNFEGGLDGIIQWDASLNKFVWQDIVQFDDVMRTGSSGYYFPGVNIDQDITVFRLDLFSGDTNGLTWDESEDDFDLNKGLDITGNLVASAGVTGSTGVTGPGFTVTLDAGGILFGSGDDDKTLLRPNVSGAPEFSWDESEDAFLSNKGLETAGILAADTIREHTLDAGVDLEGLTFEDSIITAGPGGLQISDASGGLSLFTNVSGGGGIFISIGDTDVAVNGTRLFVRDDTETISHHAANNIINSLNGFNYAPGSDVDVDLITVDVTGSPGFSWDESEDSFNSTNHVQSPNGLFRTTTALALANSANQDMFVVTLQDHSTAIIEVNWFVQDGDEGAIYTKFHATQGTTTPTLTTVTNDNFGSPTIVISASTADTGTAGTVTYNLSNSAAGNVDIELWVRVITPCVGDVTLTIP